jgi:hypothetical protein
MELYIFGLLFLKVLTLGYIVFYERGNNLAIVWYYKDDEIHIHQIYNHDTGEVYWDYESMGNMDWTDNDDKLVGSILMYGNLESVIGIN